MKKIRTRKLDHKPTLRELSADDLRAATGGNTNPLYTDKGLAGNNPLYEGSSTAGNNPLYEGSSTAGMNPLYKV